MSSKSLNKIYLLFPSYFSSRDMIYQLPDFIFFIKPEQNNKNSADDKVNHRLQNVKALCLLKIAVCAASNKNDLYTSLLKVRDNAR